MQLISVELNYWALLVPVVSALLGWLFCKWISYRFITAVVANQSRLAEEAGRFAATQFSTSFNVEEKISNPALLDSAMPAIEQHIDEFLHVKLKEEMPMIGMFIGNKTTDKLKELFIVQLKTLFPAIMSQMAGNLQANVNIGQLVSNKISQVPPAQLEQAIRQRFSGEMAKLHMAGAIAGLIIGLINLLLFTLAAGNS